MRNISVLDERYFERDDQSTAGCFYYPEPKPGVPVVFPGKCTDNDVSVINNFNATAVCTLRLFQILSKAIFTFTMT